MKVCLMYSPGPRQVSELELELEAGSTIEQALQHSGWLALYPELTGAEACVCGIWGRKADRHTPLREGDRVEWYRALRVDPKVARRQRFQRQGSRNAGLFASRRPGAKPGY